MQPQPQPYCHDKYLESEIERINQREIEDKRRAQLKEVIPVDSFINPSTGQLDNDKFQNELEKRVKSNVSVEEISELYENIENIRSYNYSNYAGKTASFNLNSNNIWFLDVFESLQRQRSQQRY